MDGNKEGYSEIPSKLDMLMQMGELQSEAVRLLVKGELSKNRGDLDSAGNAYDKLISVSKEHLQIALLHNVHHQNPVTIPPIVQPLVNAMFTRADILQSIGNLKQAEELRNEALELSHKHLSVSDSADMELSRASSLISQGRFNEALVALTASRDLFQSEGNIIKLAKATVEIADILQWLGDYKRALSEIHHASEIITPLVSEGAPTQQDIVKSVLDTVADFMKNAEIGRQALDTAELYRVSVEIDYYQGLINRALRNFEDAEKFFMKVLPEYKNLGVGPAIEYQLASILVESGKYREGLNSALSLEPFFTSGGFLRPKLAALLKIQATALLNLNETNEALSKLQKGIEDLAVYYDPDLLWKIYWLQGQALEALNKKGEALSAYAQSADTISNLRKAPLGYRLDNAYLNDKIDFFEGAIDLACSANSAEECCIFIEMIKSRILTATLSIPRTSRDENVDDLDNQVEELTRQIDAVEYLGYKEGQSDKLKGQRESLLTRRAALLEQIRFSDPRWRNMSEPVAFNLQRIAEVLTNRGHVALDLFYQVDHIVAVMIKDGKSTVGKVKISSDINAKLEDYQRNLQTTNPDPKVFDVSTKLGIEADHLLPSNLLSQALKAEGLIIVPHGPLHLLPWAGLIFKEKRLFEYCSISVLPNLSCILSLSIDFSTKPEIALIGAPDYSNLTKVEDLSYAETEIEDIKGIYSSRADIIGSPLTSKDATEEKFWELLGHPDAESGILHIACHGTLDLEDPMNSGLLLTDSKVDASEIARSEFRFNEVILSACSTGWRPMQVQDIKLVGDDVLGLPGAFLEAGARSVLVSIPPVNDLAAYNFMVLYHEHRAEGKTPLVALQEAQKMMLTKAEYPPHYWIGFTMYGC